MNKIFLLAAGSVFVITSLTFFTPENELNAHGKKKHARKVSKNEITYTSNIKPLFEKTCEKCHGAKSPVHMEFVKDMKHYKKKMKGPRMDSYTYLTSFIVWPDTGSLMRALDDGRNRKNKKPGKMYKHLGKTEEERQKKLKLFKGWIGHWTLKEWDEIRKEEITKMKLIY